MSERRRRGHCISATSGEGVKRCTEVASGNLFDCSKQKQHRNPSSFLINPKFLLEPGHADAFSTNIQFYRWCLQENVMRSTATLLYGRHFPTGEFGRVSTVAHCDGLMLLPTDTKVYVFNPATKDAIALPESQRNMMWHHRCLPVGLGLDTSTGKYKVARPFYRSRSSDPMEIVAMGMEVFNQWRTQLLEGNFG
ncbi:hypothetical protein C2845_PM09G24480 [Panicum miliaceum]|uniref:Uncharacterized protein n=1 Tax=Panicum miliaceum TaxID=4540 RepID=A0A3L6S441_PANMI|nr:hypothetical protein C2845_PM09G24480 [Panicum miliaceum]